MNDRPAAKFEVGEVAVLYPPHPSAHHLRGKETTILSVSWMCDAPDGMQTKRTGWSYETDIIAPSPFKSSKYGESNWIWCEYDLRKKHAPGKKFQDLMHELTNDNVLEES